PVNAHEDSKCLIGSHGILPTNQPPLFCGPCMPGFCEGNIVADETACPEYSLANPSAPADSKKKPGSSSDRVKIFVVCGCMSRPPTGTEAPAVLNTLKSGRNTYMGSVAVTHVPD